MADRGDFKIQHGSGGKRIEGRRKKRGARDRREEREEGCLMPRIITAFNLERPRVALSPI